MGFGHVVLVAGLLASGSVRAQTELPKDGFALISLETSAAIFCAAREGDLNRVRAWTMGMAGKLMALQEYHGKRSAEEYARAVDAAMHSIVEKGEDPCSYREEFAR